VERFWSEIFLVDHAVVTDDEGSHAGDTVFSGCGDQREAADHSAFHHKIQFTKGSRRALSLQDFEKVPVIRFRTAGVALLDRFGDVLADGTFPIAISILPRKTILLTGRAHNALSILMHVVTFPRFERIVMLRLDIAAAN